MSADKDSMREKYRRMLKPEHKRLLREILEKRAPEWLSRIEDILSGNITKEEWLDDLINTLSDELIETGIGADWEVNERGCLIEDLLYFLPQSTEWWWE